MAWHGMGWGRMGRDNMAWHGMGCHGMGMAWKEGVAWDGEGAARR